DALRFFWVGTPFGVRGPGPALVVSRNAIILKETCKLAETDREPQWPIAVRQSFLNSGNSKDYQSGARSPHSKCSAIQEPVLLNNDPSTANAQCHVAMRPR